MTYPIWFGGDGDAGAGRERRPSLLSRHDRKPHHSAEPIDGDIVTRIRASDAAAFERLFRDLYAPLVRFARTYGLTNDLAGDVVIDVFAAVWETRAEWSPATSIAAYFFRATRNRALNTVRDARTAQRYLDAASSELEAPLMGAPFDRPDQLLDREERTISLWNAVATLPERQRVLLVLRWRDALALEEIAAVLGLSVGATKTALTRAASALRTILPDDFR